MLIYISILFFRPILPNNLLNNFIWGVGIYIITSKNERVYSVFGLVFTSSITLYTPFFAVS